MKDYDQHVTSRYKTKKVKVEYYRLLGKLASVEKLLQERREKFGEDTVKTMQTFRDLEDYKNELSGKTQGIRFALENMDVQIEQEAPPKVRNKDIREAQAAAN